METVSQKSGLDSQLHEKAYGFDFFQAVRLLERLSPDCELVGFDNLPAREVVRFRSHPQLAFQASEIYEIVDRSSKELPPLMTVTFFGLYGQQGALPQHYTELLIDRMMRKDHTLRAFLDLFNHRLISLFYRAGEKYRFWKASERAFAKDQQARKLEPEKYRSYVLQERPKQDLFSQILLDLCGLGNSSLRYRADVRQRLESRTSLPDETYRFYSGLLSQRHRTAIGLESLLEGYFGCPARVVQFCGQWLILDREDQSQMVPKGNTQLGVSFVAGDRVWDVQGKFRVSIGPMGYDQFCEFLPVGSAYRPLTELIRLYVGPQFDFDIELKLFTADIPRCQLGAAEGLGARLGWNTWSHSGEFQKEVENVRLLVQDE